MKSSKLQAVFLLFTGIAIVAFCFYMKRKVQDLRRNEYHLEQNVGTLKIENFELKDILTAIYDTDWNVYNSQINQMPIEGNTIILRVTENTCLNCYFEGLKNATNLISRKYGDSVNFWVLGKYRFNARLLNDMKDIVDVDVKKINLDVSLPLDELDAPYLLYFNESRRLSKFFVFEKGNGECSYSFLDSLNVKK